MPSSTVENYLKAIWSLQGSLKGGGLVLIGHVAEKLSVTPGTATTMMNQLEKKGLIEYRPRRGVRLKEEGHRAAMQVLRRHRLIETFLVEVMKLDWAEVHEEAEVLEHVVSDRLLKQMDVMLHHPTHDPHGSPIPSPDGKITRDGTAILADCQPGCYILKRVREDQPGFLQWLSDLKLLPGTEFVLSSVNSMAGTLRLTLEEDEEVIEISNTASRSLLVVKVD
tara:strand:- start:6 stop:674 length:669 start_codon:yes stop_codon:yes gene_type:complete